MAGTLALNVEILGQFNKLTTATNGAAGQLQGLQGKVSSIGAGIGKVLGAIGVGFSLGFLKRELTEAAKAAIDEAKTMEILSIAMQNTGLATKETVVQAEDAIKKMSLQSAVADDKLRPAYQKLFIATGNVTDSNRYLQIALDASAATGKDLDSVTQAMAKSLAGQDTALLKLIPSLRGAEDPLAKLGETFAGAATAAANLDPYQRISVAMGEIQESIGMVLLPALNEFADFMVDAVPKIQAFFGELIDPTTELGESWERLGSIFENVTEVFMDLLETFGLSDVEFTDILNFVSFLTAAFGQLIWIVGRAAAILRALMEGNIDKALGLGANFFTDMEAFRQDQNRALNPEQARRQAELLASQRNQNIVINTYNSNITAQEIADKINRATKASGTTLIAQP
jgi:hypothetical protein